MKIKNESIIIAQAVREWFTIFLPKARGVSENTQKSYHDALTLFFTFLSEVKKIDSVTLTGKCFSQDLIKEWLLWMKDNRGIKNVTCNQRLIALRSFLRFLQSKDNRFIEMMVQAQSIQPMKCPKMEQMDIKRDALKTLFAVIDTSTDIGRRDLALFFLMYSIGARIDEILSLRIEDVHINNGEGRNFLALIGKGNKRRTPPVLKELQKVLKGYIDRFHGKNPNPDAFLFSSMYAGTGKLTQSAINKRLRLYASLAHEKDPSVPLDFHCHCLRHARATHWLEENLNIVAIQRLMGHDDIRTTMRYVFVSPEQQSKALASLEDDVTKNTAKKWKNVSKKQSLTEYLGL